MRFKLLQRYSDAMLRSLCVASTAISSAEITIEIFISADKSTMYNKYRNELMNHISLVGQNF